MKRDHMQHVGVESIDINQAQKMLDALGPDFLRIASLVLGLRLKQYVVKRAIKEVIAEIENMNVQQYIDDLKLHTLEKQIIYLQVWAKANPQFSPLTTDEWGELNDLLCGKTDDPERKRALIDKAVQLPAGVRRT